MSDRPVPPRPAGISQEQWERVSGGDCTTPTEITELMRDLRGEYDALVDFTSYVIERVVGP